MAGLSRTNEARSAAGRRIGEGDGQPGRARIGEPGEAISDNEATPLPGRVKQSAPRNEQANADVDHASQRVGADDGMAKVSSRLKRGTLDNPSIQRNIQWAEERLAQRQKETPEDRRKLYDERRSRRNAAGGNSNSGSAIWRSGVADSIKCGQNIRYSAGRSTRYVQGYEGTACEN
jgi:hypothetical protein